MSSYWAPALLLFFCWIAALSTLLVFLESWFAVSGKDRFVGRRASGTYGPVTVFLLMRGPLERVEKTIRSILGQTYPFVELFLIYFEDDVRHASLAREFRSGSHVQVRSAAVSHSLQMADERIRALEQTQPLAKGRWYVVLDSGIILDRLAVESSLEFAGTGEFSAIALRPGMQCRSALQRLVAPSLEYGLRLMRIAERRRERAKKINFEASYLLVNRESFEALNRMNRLPGILNEASWTLWGYEVEGLRTFDGDGSRSMWRETSLRSWPIYSERDRRFTRRSAGLALAAAVMSFIPVVGLVYSLTRPVLTFPEWTILAFSAASYVLMTVSYYLHARRYRAAAWFAPFWFLTHWPASLVMFLNLRRGASAGAGRAESIQKAGAKG